MPTGQRVNSEDFPEVIRLRAEGLSLRKIGLKYGVSGERVRQILNEQGVEPSGPDERRALRRTAQIQAARARMQAGDPQIGLSKDLREAVLASFTTEEWIEVEMRRRARTFDPELYERQAENCRLAVENLKKVAAGLDTDSLSISQYRRAVAKDADTALFSPEWILRLYGTWREALAAADLTSPWRSVREYERMPDAELLDAVRRFVLDYAAPERLRFSADVYSKWAKAHGEPARETIQLRFGWWRAALTKALAKEESTA